MLLACFALIGAGVNASDEKPSDKPAANSQTNAPTFQQPKTFAELLALPPRQLEQVDVALINLLCAEGLRGSEDLDVDYFTRTLNGWAAHVESETKRNQHLFDEHPEKFKNSLAYFRMAMLATVLVQDLRIQYNPEREKQLENGHILRREDEKAFFADSKDVFVHGLLSGKHYGTCASLPFLYVAIGKRLGYPNGSPVMNAESITGYAVLDSKPNEVSCVTETHYYWWNCYDAVKEGGNSSRSQGWSAGGDSFSGSYSPSWFNKATGINWPFDPFHIAMDSAVIVVGCVGGNMHAMIKSTDGIVWDWAKPGGGWVGPYKQTQ